jgi:hypothetical protein
MFLGHFAAGFAAKRLAPSVSLGALFAAAQFADLLWPNLLLLGIEKLRIAPGITAVTPLDFAHYPWSHSLLMMIVWGLLFGAAYRFARHSAVAAAVVLGALVVSHWALDAVAHRPDLPLLPGGSARIGLGLWNSVPATVIVEMTLFIAGLLIYLRSTRTRDRIGRYGLAGLVAFFLVINVANLLGPPPPSPMAVAWTAQAMWLIVLWGFWVDRHREPAL